MTALVWYRDDLRVSDHFALHAAAKAKGEFGFGAQWAGQGAPLSRPMPAADLVALLRSEMMIGG